MSRDKHPPAPADDEPFDDIDNPEWTDEMFARAKPAHEVLPPEVLAAFPRTQARGAQKRPTKVPISVRLSSEVVEHFRATGPGWQARIDDVLKQAIASKSA
jgi:uncharacterized protein (DUF4415 family)